MSILWEKDKRRISAFIFFVFFADVRFYVLGLLHNVNQERRCGMEEKEMNSKEVIRLMEWLKQNGFTDEQILECIVYIAKDE